MTLEHWLLSQKVSKSSIGRFFLLPNGYPHQETLAILNKYDIKVLRADQEGDIKIISDRNNLLIKN